MGSSKEELLMNVGTPDLQAAVEPRHPRSKTTAVVLAVFLGFWAWRYTFRIDRRKFLLGAVACGLAVTTGLLALAFPQPYMDHATCESCGTQFHRLMSGANYKPIMTCKCGGELTWRLERRAILLPRNWVVLGRGFLSHVFVPLGWLVSWLWPVIRTTRRPAAFYEDYPNYRAEPRPAPD
jgi:hypothetical protein